MTEPPVSPWRWSKDLGWHEEDEFTPIFDGMYRALANRWKSLDEAAGIPEGRRMEAGKVGAHSDRDHDGIADRVQEAKPAKTAGEQDHSDPWVFAAEEADPPEDTGRPADD